MADDELWLSSDSELPPDAELLSGVEAGKDEDIPELDVKMRLLLDT